MNKIQIYYFSGTGNTFRVLNKLSKHLTDLSYRVTLTSCEKVEDIDVSCDILGIAYPVHSSIAPRIFREFINRFPNVNKKPLFGIITSGYMAGDVLSYESKKLRKKGYVPFLFRNIVVANNLHLPLLCPLKVTKQEVVEKRLIRIDKQVKDIAIKIDKKTKDIRGNNVVGKVFGMLQRSLGKVHENINFYGFSSDDKCILCMRCYNFCPRDAIQSTSKTKNNFKYKRYKGPEGLGDKTPFN